MGYLGFSRLGNMGRLGNQLFQIGAVMGIANKAGMIPVLPEDWKYRKYFSMGDHYYRDGIAWDDVVSELLFSYGELLPDRGRNIDLSGYFQSEKYWEDYYGYVRGLLQWDEDFLSSTLKKYMPADYISNSRNNYCAVHVRRGDYVNNRNYINLSAVYYKQAMGDALEVNKNMKFILFSDDEQWCRKNLEGNFIYLKPGRNEIEDMALMGGLCSNFIIGNSTFAWWGAYLGEWPGKSLIIAPAEWFGEGLIDTHTAKDILPAHWNKIDVCGLPDCIDLRDVSFTIPVCYDHEDRVDNLMLCIGYLRRNFDTLIIVCEEGKESKFEWVKNWGCEYVFRKREDGLFHRTKMLNDMARMAKTKLVANWDADVFVRPEHLLKAVEMLRRNECDGVYPYDGRFYRVGREYVNDISETKSIDCLRNHLPSRYEMDAVSYGGAVLWKRDKFFEFGGENENFISYGPEDVERWERFNKLGARIERCGGVLWHINHFVGANSSDGHRHFNKNNAELNRVQNMRRHELAEYVKGWAWKNLPSAEKSVLHINEKSSSRLDEFGVEKFYLLNLKRRPERLAWAKERIKEMGIKEVVLWDAVDAEQRGLKADVMMSPGMKGCFMSHREIWKDALDNNLETIMVMEDDLLPVGDINFYLDYFVKNVPDDWQFLWIGYGTHGSPNEIRKGINKYWVVPKAPWGTHAYMVRSREALEYLLKETRYMEKQIDNTLCHDILWKDDLKMYACVPSIIQQNFADFETDCQESLDRFNN